MPKDSGLGQGMCQNVMMVARGSLAHHARQQREVIVLHQHDRVVGVRFGDHRVGEALVDLQYCSQSEERNTGRTWAIWHSGHRPSLAKP